MPVLNWGGVSTKSSNCSRHTGARTSSCVSCSPPTGVRGAGAISKRFKLSAACMLFMHYHCKWCETPGHATCTHLDISPAASDGPLQPHMLALSLSRLCQQHLHSLHMQHGSTQQSDAGSGWLRMSLTPNPDSKLVWPPCSKLQGDHLRLEALQQDAACAVCYAAARDASLLPCMHR